MTQARAARERRSLTRAIKQGLRDVGAQLSRLSHGVGGRLDLKASDLECLDAITRYGPLSPTALARHTGQHPATVTGILDRLERGGWISRARDPADRRGVLLHVERARGAELLGLYSGMNSAMDDICAGYGEADLELIADFLRRTADAGRVAADDLSQVRTAPPPR